MKRIFAIALALFCATTFGATLNPIQLLNPAGSASGQAIVSTGPTGAPVWGSVLPASSASTSVLLGPHTPINVFVNPNDTGHYSDFAITQSNAGAHTTYSNTAFSISSLPVGSGIAGPSAADTALTVSNLKANWNTTATLGEIDGVYIVNRNGTGSTSGVLIDSGIVSGFGNAIEAVSRQYAAATQAVVLGMDTQVGSIQTGASGPASSAGFVATAQNGTMGSGLLVQSNAGAGWGNAITVSSNGGGANTFVVTPAGAVSATGQTIAAVSPAVTLNDSSGSGATHSYIQSNGVTQWDIQKSGANNLLFQRYLSGTALDNPITISSATGLVTVSDGLTISSGAITPVSTSGIVGTTTSNNANAGSVGEYVTASSASTAITNGAPTNIVSISLTAGDWDVSGLTSFVAGASTNAGALLTGISTTSATFGALGSQAILQATFTAATTNNVAAPTWRVSVASATTVYLVAQTNYTGSTFNTLGFIRARRIR